MTQLTVNTKVSDTMLDHSLLLRGMSSVYACFLTQNEPRYVCSLNQNEQNEPRQVRMCVLLTRMNRMSHVKCGCVFS